MYGFAKGHVLANGNKRCGIMAVGMFYELNNRILKISSDEMYALAKHIANSVPSEKDETINYVADLLKTRK